MCLFAHFDQHGRIDAYVEHYLGALAELDFDCILVSTSPELQAADVERGLRFCRAVIHRENLGLDFGSWKSAAEVMPDIWEYDRVLLANDSVFGPFTSLRPILERMERAVELVCAMNDSYEVAHHLQSFFLYLKRPLFALSGFRAFWRDMRLTNDKDYVIRNYEVGFSRMLSDQGVGWYVAFSYDAVMQRAKAKGIDFQYSDLMASTPLNATLFMWDILLTDFGYPFIKTELLKTNRFKSLSVPLWRALLPPSNEMLAAALQRYLERVGAAPINPAECDIESTLKGSSSSAQAVIVVLGMHRSGTSLLASVLHALGVEFGERLMAGRADNPRGFWEHRGIVALHDEILARLDRAWPGVHASLPYPALWWRRPEFAEVKSRLRTLVEDELARSGRFWGFKDPRTCRLFPMWRELLDEMHVKVLPVLALRHPGAVSASLAKRDGLTAAESQLLWLQHTLEPLPFLEDRMPVTVDFDEWLGGDPLRPALRLIAALGLGRRGEDDDLAQAVQEAVAPELSHHVANEEACSPIVLEAYRMLLDTHEGKPIPSRLLAVREELLRYEELFRAWGERLAAVTDPELARHPLNRALLVDDERARWRQFFAATVPTATSRQPGAQLRPLPRSGRERATRLRICMVGGSSGLSDALVRDGHEVVLLQLGAVAGQGIGEVPAIALPIGAPLAHAGALEHGAWRLYEWLAAQPAFDLVHAWDSASLLYHALMARRHGLAFVDTTFVSAVHDATRRAARQGSALFESLDLLGEHLERRSIECSDYALVASDAALQRMVTLGVVLPERSYILPEPWDWDAWLAWHRTLGLVGEMPRPKPEAGPGLLDEPLVAVWGRSADRPGLAAHLPPSAILAPESNPADAVSLGSTPYVLLVSAGALPQPAAVESLVQGLLHSGSDGCVCFGSFGAAGGERLPAIGGAVAALASGCALAAPALIARRAALATVRAGLPTSAEISGAELNAIQAALTLSGYVVDTVPAALFAQANYPAAAAPPQACFDAVPALLHGLIWRGAHATVLQAENERLHVEVSALRASRSWRLTAPLRRLRTLLRGG